VATSLARGGGACSLVDQVSRGSHLNKKKTDYEGKKEKSNLDQKKKLNDEERKRCRNAKRSRYEGVTHRNLRAAGGRTEERGKRVSKEKVESSQTHYGDPNLLINFLSRPKGQDRVR